MPVRFAVDLSRRQQAVPWEKNVGQVVVVVHVKIVVVAASVAAVEPPGL